MPFLSRDRAAQLVSSLRLAAVALREERSPLLIDTPLAVAELCAEMRFLSHESLRVVLINTKQELIKVVSVSQGTLNEAPAHPRDSPLLGRIQFDPESVAPIDIGFPRPRCEICGLVLQQILS